MKKSKKDFLNYDQFACRCDAIDWLRKAYERELFIGFRGGEYKSFLFDTPEERDRIYNELVFEINQRP